jgi:ABC-type cobalamin/Fe3+-siderophores transport system ATPase subunit
MTQEDNSNTIFQNGSRWLRADFHLHTDADREFRYKGDKNYYYSNYIDSLIRAGIKIGVITNHNKFALEEYKSLRKTAKEKDIFLLPGVELSANDGANGIHILIVFSEKWLENGQDYINPFISSMFVGKSEQEYQNQNAGSDKNILQIFEELDKAEKGYFVIFAHVEDSKGLWKETGGGKLSDFASDRYNVVKRKTLGFQKVRTNDYREKVKNWLGNDWYPAEVEGSDCKTIEEIGKGKKCYLKIGDFDFEAVQYALIDYKNRVSAEELPQIKNSYIKSISFDGGLLNGKKIFFSYELNNLIGIRGSGKSSILEILRYALNIPLSPQAADKEYKDKLIEHVLKSGGKVVVEVIDNTGKEYRIERIYGQKEDIYIGQELQQAITIDAILQQPIYFGQKDLSNKNSDFENGLIDKLIGIKLKDVRSKIDAQKQQIKKIINDLQALQNLSEVKKDTEIAKSNAEHKLKIFEEKGIAEKLKMQTVFNADISNVDNYKKDIDAYIQELKAVINNYKDLTLKTFSSDINADFFEEVGIQVEALKKEFEILKNLSVSSQDIGDKLNDILLRMNSKQNELKEGFAEIKREINIAELNPEDFISLNRTVEIAKLKLAELEKSEAKRKELETQLANAVKQLDDLWHESFRIVGTEINNINELGTKIKIESKYKNRKDKFLNQLQTVFKGSGIREAAFKTISEQYADFIDIYKDNFNKLSETLNENQRNAFKNGFLIKLYELLTYKVDDEIIINFDNKPLKQHSLGQRASALILFLLAQKENDVLIIDQPEDDLDNQTIYQDVIKEIKKLKGKMQFIFATHNANIPVLGDSEMIVACEYIDGKEIKLDKGSIDCHTIQEKIIRIMEGGKEAFNFRKNIYKIWERNNG